jgi:hypothetical protein
MESLHASPLERTLELGSEGLLLTVCITAGVLSIGFIDSQAIRYDTVSSSWRNCWEC